MTSKSGIITSSIVTTTSGKMTPPTTPVITSKAEVTSEADKVTTQKEDSITTTTSQPTTTTVQSTTEKAQVTTNETSVITEVVMTTEKTRVCFYLGKIIPEGETILVVPCTKVTCERGGRDSQVINIDVRCSGSMIQSSLLCTMLALIFFLLFGGH